MRTRWLVCLCILALLPLSAASAQPAVDGWGTPTGIYHNTSIDFPSANAAATQVVFVNQYSNTPGYTEWYYDRQVILVEYTGGAWSSTVVGSNAIYRPIGWVPITTHPVISADGSTIAYLGCTGNCKPFTSNDTIDIYVSYRGLSGWSAPVGVTGGAIAIDSQIALSADGSTIAYASDYLNFPFYKFNQTFIIQRIGETWGAPTPVSTDDVNAFFPALSRDGKQVIWLSNPPPASGVSYNVLMYTRQLAGGGWSAPQMLETNLVDGTNIAQYRFSPDGNSVFFWTYTVEGNVCTENHLYRLRWNGAAWGAREEVTPGALIPFDSCGVELTAGVNSDGTRAIYPHPLMHDNVVDDVSLEMVEYKSGAWGTPTAITAHKPYDLYQYPMLFSYTSLHFSYLPFMKK